MKVGGTVPAGMHKAVTQGGAADGAAWHQVLRREMEREQLQRDRLAGPAHAGRPDAGTGPTADAAAAWASGEVSPSRAGATVPGEGPPAASDTSSPRVQAPAPETRSVYVPAPRTGAESRFDGAGLAAPRPSFPEGAAGRMARPAASPSAQLRAEMPRWFPTGAHVSVQGSGVHVSLRNAELSDAEAEALYHRLGRHLRTLGLELARMRVNGRSLNVEGG